MKETSNSLNARMLAEAYRLILSWPCPKQDEKEPADDVQASTTTTSTADGRVSAKDADCCFHCNTDNHNE